MRLLLLIIVVLNVGLFALGRGYFGTPPSEAGRGGALKPPINSDRVSLGEPVLNPQRARLD